MKKLFALSLFAAAGTSVAVAAPREFAEFTGVNSNDRIGATVNETRTFTATGGYAVGFIAVEGEISRDSVLNGSWFGEACVLVTPPGGGAPFVVQSIAVADPGVGVNTGAILAGSFTVPIAPIADAAGEWTFQFFEMWDDVAATASATTANSSAFVDATWTRIRFTLDDGAVPYTPPAQLPGTVVFHTQDFTNVDSDNGAILTGLQQTFTVPAGANIVGWQASGLVTPFGSGVNAAANQAGSLADDAIVRIVPPGLALDALEIGGALPIGGGSRSTATGNIGINYTNQYPSAGTWTAVLYEAADVAGGPDNRWHQLKIRLISQVTAPPVAVDLGVLTPPFTQAVNVGALAAGEVKWVRFELPKAVRWPSQTALRLDTENTVTAAGSGTTPTSNAALALFTSFGSRVGADFADGSTSQAQLSFGWDNAAPVGAGTAAGVRYNGRDGFLSAGVYYAAVTVGDTGVTVGPGFFGITSTRTTGTTANAVLNVAFLDPATEASNAANAPATPGAQNFGLIGYVGTPAEVVSTVDVNVTADLAGTATTATAPASVGWAKFTIGRDASDATGFYVDVDTAGSNHPGVVNPNNTLLFLVEPNDTEMAVYSSLGNLITKNDDADADAADLDVVVTSGLSFGDTDPTRPAPVTGGLAGNGRSGVMPAGTYYVAAGMWQHIFGLQDPADANAAASTRATDGARSDTNFAVARTQITGWLTGSTPGTGPVRINVRTNMPKACGLSDIASPGEVVGPNGELTADDIIVFIGWFFASDVRADVASSGLVPVADGQFTADDIIVFINRFFAGCA